MRLCSKVVDLIGFYFLDYPDQVGGVGQVAVMKLEVNVRLMRILVEMVNPLRIEKRASPFNAMHLVALLQKQFGKIGAVLTRNTRNEGDFSLHEIIVSMQIYKKSKEGPLWVSMSSLYCSHFGMKKPSFSLISYHQSSSMRVTDKKKNLTGRVLEAIETMRPFLKADGGDVELIDIDDENRVHIRLLGQCRNCSMSAMTLKAGIEESIKRAAPEVLEVVEEASLTA